MTIARRRVLAALLLLCAPAIAAVALAHWVAPLELAAPLESDAP